MRTHCIKVKFCTEHKGHVAFFIIKWIKIASGRSQNMTKNVLTRPVLEIFTVFPFTMVCPEPHPKNAAPPLFERRHALPTLTCSGLYTPETPGSLNGRIAETPTRLTVTMLLSRLRYSFSLARVVRSGIEKRSTLAVLYSPACRQQAFAL